MDRKTIEARLRAGRAARAELMHAQPKAEPAVTGEVLGGALEQVGEGFAALEDTISALRARVVELEARIAALEVPRG